MPQALALSQIEYKGESRWSGSIIPSLIKALESHNQEVCFHAARLCAKVGAVDRALITALLAERADPVDLKTKGDANSYDPGAAAIQALGEIAPGTAFASEVVASLIRTVQSPGRAERRRVAADSLAKFGRDQAAVAVPVLIKSLTETATINGPPAPAVAAALGKLAPGTTHADEAVVALDAALNSPWEYTRRQAAEALAGFGKQAVRAASPDQAARGRRPDGFCPSVGLNRPRCDRTVQPA